jgi:nucleotide-binding universal stress UspA family protein
MIRGGQSFPDVRRVLAQWALSEENDAPCLLASKLGIEVDNSHIKRQEPVQGILQFLQQATCDLMVLATRGGGGFDHWLRGSVSEIASRHSAVRTLFVTSGARGFVDQITGDVSIRRVLVPIDFSPTPGKAIKAVHRFSKLLTGDVHYVLHLLHVGRSAPAIRVTARDRSGLPGIILRSGNVPTTIIDAAIEFDVGLIAMPTAGRHGILDALRGSTTERVIRHAPCPVFAIPEMLVSALSGRTYHETMPRIGTVPPPAPRLAVDTDHAVVIVAAATMMAMVMILRI